MEQTVLNRPWPQPEHQRPGRDLPVVPGLLLLALILVVASTLLVLGTYALGLFARQGAGSFLDFADIFPGQPRKSIEAHSGRLLVEGGNEYYSLQLADGPFSSITVRVLNGIIREAYFTPRENALQAGDLMVLWGRPDVQEVGPVLYLFWQHLSVYALVSESTGHFSPRLPISKIALSNNLRSPY